MKEINTGIFWIKVLLPLFQMEHPFFSFPRTSPPHIVLHSGLFDQKLFVGAGIFLWSHE